MAGEPTRENPNGPIGTEVVYENDRVRVWDMKVPPGGKKAWHHHTLDYVIINVTGGKIELENVRGQDHRRPTTKSAACCGAKPAKSPSPPMTLPRPDNWR